MMTNETLPLALGPEAIQFAADRLDIEELISTQQTKVASLVDQFADAADEGLMSGDAGNVLMFIEDELWRISGTERAAITTASAEASRLFGGLLFERISNLERSGQQREAERLARAASVSLFSSSPNVVSYSGNPKEQFLLLAMAQATPTTRSLSKPMIGELAYAVSFGYDEHIFVNAVQGKTPAEQLQSLQVLRRIAGWADGNGDWADPAVRKAAVAFEAVADDVGASELVRKIAAADAEELVERRHLETIELGELSYEDQERMLNHHRTRQEDFRQTQSELRQQFPEFPAHDGASLVRLAKDSVALCDEHGISLIGQRFDDGSSRMERLDSVLGTPDLGLSAEQGLLLAELHRPSVCRLVEEDLGVSLSDVSLGAQIYLLDYMSRAETVHYTRLTRLMNEAPASTRPELCEAFLALEFGDDFGDVLLDVVEATDTTELAAALAAMSGIRHSARGIAAAFASDNKLDIQVSEAVQLAFTKRTTELLALAKEHGLGEITESLHTIAQAAQYIAVAMNHRNVTVAERVADRLTLQAPDVPVTITLRSSGENARIGFTVRGLGADGKQRLSIRLDYETDHEAGSRGLSLDIGSTAKEGVHASEISRKIGADLARGELALALLRIERGMQPVVLHGNHVREAFAHLSGLSPAEFSGVVQGFLQRLRVQSNQSAAA